MTYKSEKKNNFPTRINGILMRFSFKDFCYDNQNFLKCFNKIVLLFYKSKIYTHYISRFIQVFRFKFELFLPP